jgi:molybdopterin-guanine dinucleotide biosynthesis protein A
MLAAVSDQRPEPMGAVLAGGAGRRIGGGKAGVQLGGRPLIHYPLAAMRQVVRDVTIVAKPDTRLPSPDVLGDVRVLYEPPAPRHPLVGIVHALQTARGRAVLVCAADMPFVTAAALAELAWSDPCGAPAVIATGVGGAQPLLGCYRPEAAPLLAAAAREATAPLRRAVAAIGPRLVALSGDEDLLFNVNSPEDLLRAEAIVATRT